MRPFPTSMMATAIVATGIALTAGLAGSEARAQQQAFEQMCRSGDLRACDVLYRVADRDCQFGDDAACLYADDVARFVNEGGGPAQQVVTPLQLCDIYPDRCTIYDRHQPRWSPYDAVPAGRGAIRNALDGMPPHFRQALYPPHVAEAVRNGSVDRMIEDRLRNGFDGTAAIINGYGPGGAGYTNQAAIGVLNGSLSPECAAMQAMSLRC